MLPAFLKNKAVATCDEITSRFRTSAREPSILTPFVVSLNSLGSLAVAG